MKKVFQTKLRSLTKVLTLVIIASLATFTGCTSYDEDITDLQGQIDKVVTDVATLKTSVAALQTSVNGMTYIKSITMGTDGKLTITPSTGTAIVYDAKNYVTYDIALVNNVLTVNGVNKGTVAIPALTFGADNKLMSGTTVVADLSSWVRTLKLSADNYLEINGTKSSILIPAATVQSVDVKSIAINGNVLTITKNDGTTSTITLPQTALTLTAESSSNGELTLNLNGVDTKVTIKNTYAVDGGFLTVNGVATTVAIPAENKSSVIINKDKDGNIISATVSDGKDVFTVKLNPSNELLSSILFVPEWINGGVNAVELGFIVDTTRVYNTAGTVVTNLTYGSGNVEALFTQQDVIFRFNPTSADVSKTTWSFINNTARVNAPGVSNAPDDASTLFAAPTYTSNNDGSGKFSLKVATWVDVVAPKTHLFALQANGKDFYSGADSKVVSDYVKVVPAPYNAYIANKTITAAFTHYTMIKPAYTGANDFTIVYNAATKTNLNALVLATAANATGSPVEKSFADYKFGTLGTDYKFTFDEVSILGADGITDQGAFINIESNGDITVLNGTAAIDRTPVVKVTLTNAAGKVLSFGYIKFAIAASSALTFTYNFDPVGPLAYNTLFDPSTGDKTPIALTWEKLNTAILPIMGLSNTQFKAIYSAAPAPVVTGTFNGATLTGTDLTNVATALDWAPSAVPGVDSYVVQYNITPKAKFGTYVLTYLITPTTGAPVKLVFTYTVSKPVLTKAILPVYQYPGLPSDILTQGTNYSGSAYAMQLFLGEAFNYGNASAGGYIGVRSLFGTTKNLINGALHQITFKVGSKSAKTYQVGASVTDYTGTAYTIPSNNTSSYPTQLLPNISNAGTLDQIIGTAGQTGVKMALTVPLTTTEAVYAMNFYTYYPNNEKDSTLFNVHFQNPLSIELISPLNPGFTLTDVSTGQKDTLDIAPNYNVKFGNKIVIARGVAQTTNTATTAKASDFGINLPTFTFSNQVPNSSPAVYYTLGASVYDGLDPVPFVPINTGSILQWVNNGTAVQNTAQVGNATITVTTASNFAKITKTDAIFVKSSSDPGFIKRK